jgi:hypothetical protein
MPNFKQIPGKTFTFIRRKTGQRNTVILPEKLGESNESVIWTSKSSFTRGGCWQSRLFMALSNKDAFKGQGPAGLISRMKHLLISSKTTAIRDGHEPAKTTAVAMIKEWELQNGLCALCEAPVELLKAHYDHDHETGQSRGFVHPFCNSIDGLLRKVRKENRQIILSRLKNRYGIL